MCRFSAGINFDAMREIIFLKSKDKSFANLSRTKFKWQKPTGIFIKLNGHA